MTWHIIIYFINLIIQGRLQNKLSQLILITRQLLFQMFAWFEFYY